MARSREHDRGSVTARARAGLVVSLALLVMGALVASLVIGELAFRIATGVPLLDLGDWRTRKVIVARLGDRAVVDPVLGWKLKSGYVSDGFNTLEHGIRRNLDETTIRTGGILAVGDSFTEGWDEVRDDETWPAYLERLTGTPVVNGAVGGYATDQIVLRAEELLPIIRPHTLIIGFNEIDIFRSAHAPFGAPKPYFTLEEGKLRYHPPGPIENRRGNAVLSAVSEGTREVLGHFALADYLFSRLAVDFWYGDTRQVYRKLDNDEVGVTCALLARLKAKAGRAGIRMLLFMQYYGPYILDEEAITDNAERVETCAEEAGIQVVDQFEPLRAIALADPEGALRSYYVMVDGKYAHMSPRGNRHAARMLAAALGRDE